jgi:tyrosyl-tRNA synthetase
MTLSNQANDKSFAGIWEELKWRGLISQSTDEAELSKKLNSGSLTFYIGFDPTAASLHLGNLVQLLVMRRLQLAGHKPIVLIGGSTGLVGDPRPTAERVLTIWTGRSLLAQLISYVRLESTLGLARCFLRKQ